MREESGWLVISDDISAHGEYPASKSVEQMLQNGFVILDKWRGPTSHDVAATVKKVLGVGKAGHCGTLDPQVSGVLPVLLENACKVTPALQKLDKEYVGVARLHSEVSKDDLERAAKKFVGEIEQKPPVRSAVKRRTRKREVRGFDILETGGREFLFRTECEAGTYVRKLIHDMGAELGGAHMTELRRTRVGPFSEKESVKMHDVADAYALWRENGDERIREYVLPVEAAARPLKKIIVKDTAVFSVSNGSPLYCSGISRLEKGIVPRETVAIITLKGELVALAEARMDSMEMTKRRGTAARPDRVIIREPYPRM